MGVLTDTSSLLPPPEPIVAAAILEANLPAAWKHGKASVAGILAQLSAQRGRPAPWFLVRQAVDGALRARLVELDVDSAAWPCDPSGASKVILKAVSGASAPTGGYGGTVINETERRTAEGMVRMTPGAFNVRNELIVAPKQ